jgi:hypothetical protein
MTKDERNHYDRISQHGCIACHVLGYGFSPCEIHHIRTGTGAGRKAHWSKAIGLCPIHHRLGDSGVAIHAGIKSFEQSIGMSEVELLNKQLELLNETNHN